jgi:hypothetical protein
LGLYGLGIERERPGAKECVINSLNTVCHAARVLFLDGGVEGEESGMELIAGGDD